MNVGGRQLASRQTIYDKWAEMEANPFVSTALKLQVTAALGGHETTGDVVFIEKNPANQLKKSDAKAKDKIADEVARDLGNMLNKFAFSSLYTGLAFGDAYVRIYSQDRVGVTDFHCDEMVRPPLVTSFERGSTTLGFLVATGKGSPIRLSPLQMARLKMPRNQWIPQAGVVEKATRFTLEEDDLSLAQLLPSMAGGSMLWNAEPAYRSLISSLAGMEGQRWLDSIDEEIIAIDTDNMTKRQRQVFRDNVTGMFQKSKNLADKHIAAGTPFLSKIVHILTKTQAQNITRIEKGAGRVGTIAVDDIMIHARAMAAALNTDLSMLGFADQLSGGLGEGGYFRVSAQSAEMARTLRKAAIDFLNWVIDIHLYHKHKIYFPAGERPWQINFYGSIAALENERADTELKAGERSAMILSSLQQMKDLGMNKEHALEFLTKEMKLDEDSAKLYVSMFEGGRSVEGAIDNAQ